MCCYSSSNLMVVWGAANLPELWTHIKTSIWLHTTKHMMLFEKLSTGQALWVVHRKVTGLAFQVLNLLSIKDWEFGWVSVALLRQLTLVFAGLLRPLLKLCTLSAINTGPCCCHPLQLGMHGSPALVLAGAFKSHQMPSCRQWLFHQFPAIGRDRKRVVDMASERIGANSLMNSDEL